MLALELKGFFIPFHFFFDRISDLKEKLYEKCKEFLNIYDQSLRRKPFTFVESLFHSSHNSLLFKTSVTISTKQKNLYTTIVQSSESWN